MAPQKSPKIREIKLGPTREVIITTEGYVIFVLKGLIGLFDTRTIFVWTSWYENNFC